MNETLYLIRQLKELVKALGYELSLEDARIIADKIMERVTVGDGIVKV